MTTTTITQADTGAPLRIAVVGHTNVGKTSLLRTLTRRIDFGEVSERPGTTRHVEQVDLRIDGRPAVRFFDTPGLEDAVTLLAHVAALEGASRPERIRRFLDGPEAHGAFEQEAKVLRTLLEVDAAFLVIDTREAPLPKYRDEIELLNSCARPVMPVLNFVGSPQAAGREGAWRELLAAAGLHAVVRFDAAAPFTGAERDLYHDLGALLPAHREALRGVATHLAQEAAARRGAACRVIAEGIIDGAALRREVRSETMADPKARQAEVDALRRSVFERAQRGIDDLLALHGFREGDAAEAPLPQLQGRWTLDLFHPETLKQAGVRLGQGAAVGAAIGVVADLAVAGISLGAGAAVGGAIGGALAQGWGPFGRRLMGRLRGVQELTVEDGVLFVMADWQLRVLQGLERRGHGATAPAANAAAPLPPGRAQALTAAVKAAQPARAHPDWAEPRRRFGRTLADGAREAVVDAVAQPVASAAAGPAD